MLVRKRVGGYNLQLGHPEFMRSENRLFKHQHLCGLIPFQILSKNMVWRKSGDVPFEKFWGGDAIERPLDHGVESQKDDEVEVLGQHRFIRRSVT